MAWMRTIAALTALAFALAPLHAYGDECEGVQLTPKKVVLGEVEYVALPKDQAACLAKRAEQKAKLEGVVASQDKQLDLQVKQIATASTAIAVTKALAGAYKLRGDDFKQLSEKQAEHIEDLEAWYRSPLFWTGVGAVGTVIVIVLLKGVVSSGSTVNVER